MIHVIRQGATVIYARGTNPRLTFPHNTQLDEISVEGTTVTVVLAEPPITMSDGADGAVIFAELELIRLGYKMSAIKSYHDRTGASYKDSRVAIDREHNRMLDSGE